MKSIISAAVATASLLVAVPQTGNAAVAYTYTGHDFTTVSGAYTKSDKVTGKLILTAALPDGANLYSPTVVSFDFTDGVQTLTQMNSTDQEVALSTNDSGVITGWRVWFGLSSRIEFLNVVGDVFDEGVKSGSSYGINSYDPGSWSGPTSVVPEPATWAMMLIGFGALGFAWRAQAKARAAA
jgi:hypothetical protein